MKYIHQLSRYLALGLVLGMGIACQKDEPQSQRQTEQLTELKTLPPYLSEGGINLNNPEGVLVLSEGALQREAGVLSFVTSGGKILSNNLIKATTGKNLGSVTQDLAVYKQRLYILSQNGRSKTPGEMQHISVFDKGFRLLKEFTPDIVADLNVQEKPKHIALAHDNIYFYAGGSIYECEADEEDDTVICHPNYEINEPIDERLYSVQRQGNEYLYVLAQKHVYSLAQGLELSNYKLPIGHRALALCLSPALVASEDIYAWVLSQETTSGAFYIIKLRNLVQEGMYRLPLNLSERSASGVSLSVLQFQSGASLLFRDKGTIYRFDTQTQLLRSIYQSGNGGHNKLYGYMGVSHRTGSIYCSEFVDYPLYHEAWLSELDLDGKLKHRYPSSTLQDIGAGARGLYTPFCAGIYPIDALYNNYR